MLFVLDTGDLVGPFTKDLLDGQRLDLVVHVGARAVGVDVVDGVFAEAGVRKGHADAGGGTTPLGMRIGDAVRIGGRTVADHLAVNLRAALLGMLEFLEPPPWRPPHRARSHRARCRRDGWHASARRSASRGPSAN